MIAKQYLVLGTKPWNRSVFDDVIQRYPGRWTFIDDDDDLTDSLLEELDPRYLFFLHWSTKVSTEMVGRYECVNFHMTEVPYGRGGSPLQNLILRGHRETVLTALRMTESFDTGPVYERRPLSLEGGAEEILIRSSRLAAEMIKSIVDREPEPTPQQGEVVVFERRSPEQSQLPDVAGSLEDVFDFIRMLDAEGYPAAFIEVGELRFEFSQPTLKHDSVMADVKITRSRGAEPSLRS